MKTIEQIKEIINKRNALLITSNDFKKLLLSSNDNEFRYQKIISKSEFYNSLFVDELKTKILIKDVLLARLNLEYNYDLVSRIYKLLALAYFSNTNDLFSDFVNEYKLIEIPRIYKLSEVYFIDIELEYTRILKDSTILEIRCEQRAHEVYNFEDKLEEIAFVAQQIRDLIDTGVNYQDIYVNSAYEQSSINLIFNTYGLFYNLESKYKYKRNKNIEQLISKLQNSEYQNINQIYEDYQEDSELVNILNKHVAYEDLSLLIGELQNHMKKALIKANNINSTTSPLLSKDKYLFVLGYNKDKIITVAKERLSLNPKQIHDYKLSTTDILTGTKTLNFINQVNSAVTILTTNNNELVETILTDIKIINQNSLYKSASINKVLYKRNIELVNKYKIVTKQMKNLANLEVEDINKQDFMLDEQTKLYDNYNLSASKIITYLKCPFSFYIAHILNIRTKSNDSALIGSFIHEVLEVYYKEQVLLPEIITKLLIDDRFKTLVIYQNQFNKYLDDLVKVLDLQLTDSKFTIDELERQITYKIDETYTFNGIADKILSYDNDKIIIDYKSGNSSLKLNDILNKYDIQNFIYINFLKKLEPDTNYVATFKQKIKPELQRNNKKHQNYQLNGVIYGQDNITNLNKSIEEHAYINNLRVLKSGEIKGSALIEQHDFLNTIDYVDNLVNEVITGLNQNKFDIASKNVDGSEISCTYCEYNDICFKNKHNRIFIKEQSE